MAKEENVSIQGEEGKREVYEEERKKMVSLALTVCIGLVRVLSFFRKTAKVCHEQFAVVHPWPCWGVRWREPYGNLGFKQLGT